MSKAKKTNQNEGSRSLGSIIVSLVLVLAVILCLSVMVQVLNKGYFSVAGYSLFRVATGSMEPEIPVGAILVCRETSIDTLELGDIINYYSREPGRFDQIITHRIVRVMTDENGVRILETKGDANLVSDPYFVTEENLIGQVTYYSGQDNVAASILSFMTSGVGFIVCLAMPCMLIAGLIMQSCVSKIKEDMRYAIEELERGKKVDPTFPYQYFTREEYEEMYERIRRELMEEMGMIPAPKQEPAEETYEQMRARLRAELIEELKGSGE